MDSVKIGALLRHLRQERGMTQKQLAEQLHLSDKTISKWERGGGLPDVSLLSDLSDLLQLDLDRLLAGDLSPNEIVGGNMKQSKYYVCPTCGNLCVSTGAASVSCCGRKLEAMQAQKASPEQRLCVEEIEHDWYISSDHPMTKDNHISFVAFATGEKLHLVKQYPEWDLSLRIPKRGHGMLLWYSAQEGLLYQLL